MTESLLNSSGILVTRPVSQADELIDAINDNGGHAFHFPVLEIRPRTDKAVQADVATLPAADIAFFASQNAVEYGLEYAGDAAIAVIGPSTAAAVRSRGASVTIEPDEGFDSESLLQHPALADVRGKIVRIIRGNGGRELLADTLQEREATVQFLCVYERSQPSLPKNVINELESAWQSGKINVVTIMSVESLLNLIDLLPETCSKNLERMPLVTPAVRVIKELQTRYPLATTLLAEGPRTNHMLAAIAKATNTGVEQTT